MSTPRQPPWAAVPSAVAPQLRLGLSVVVEEIVQAVSLEVPVYSEPLRGDFGVLVREGVGTALERFLDLLGTSEPVPDQEAVRALGRNEHREGRTLDALQAAYRVGARIAWRRVAEFGEQQGLQPRVLYRLAEAIFAYIDGLAAASVAGFAAAQSATEGMAHARRHALVELVSRWPPASPGDVARAAQQADWTPPRTVAMVAVGAQDLGALARRLPLPSGTLGAALDPVPLLLVPDPDGPGRPAQLAAGLSRVPAVLGPTVPWEQAYRSAARVRAAWPLHRAGALGPELLVRADDHRLALLLAADPDLAGDLVAARLAPLGELTPASRERTRATVQAWLDAHGDVTVAAAALHVHPQTVRYRLGGLPAALAEDLADPQRRLEVALALRVTELGLDDGRPAPPG